MCRKHQKIGLRVGLMTLSEVLKRLWFPKRPLNETLQQIIDNKRAGIQLKRDFRKLALAALVGKLNVKIQDWLTK